MFVHVKKRTIFALDKLFPMKNGGVGLSQL